MSSDSINVIFMVSTLRRTGPTRQLLNIIRNFERVRFSPAILTLSPEPADTMWRDFMTVNTCLRTLGESRVRSALRRDWARLLRRTFPVETSGNYVVHSQGIRADCIAASHLRNSPRVSTMRNFPRQDYVMKFGPVLGRWMAQRHLRAFQRLPCVIACSSALARLAGLHGIKADVIRNGVDTQRFAPATDQEKRALRGELGFSEGVSLIVSIGTSARKDPSTVTAAIRSSTDAGLKLILIDSEPKSEDLVSRDDRIALLKRLEDVRPYLRCADIFVSASRSEGMPNAVLEAMACGLPVVLSDIPAHREILSMAPGAGMLFPCGDVGALRLALERILSNINCAAVRQAHVGDDHDFSAATMSRAYQSVYERLARAGAPLNE